MIVSFTGTQKGMTEAQRQRVYDLLLQHRPDAVSHGDCIGADADFHALVVRYGRATGRIQDISFILRPGHDGRGLSPKRAHCETNFKPFNGIIYVSEPYLRRNPKIAEDGTVLIATPKEFTEQLRGSGTWATIRAAHRLHKSIQIVYPDGRLAAYHPTAGPTMRAKHP